jgi:hypothetical protein
MQHRIKWALVLAAAAGIVAVPTVASAQPSSTGNVGTVIVGDENQVAGDDIINAGCDANIGSFNGSHDEHHGSKCDRDKDRDHKDRDHKDKSCRQHEDANGRDDKTTNGSDKDSSGTASSGNVGTVIVGDRNQIAGDDIINAGRDANIGSFDGSDLGPEMASLMSGL